MRSQKNRSPTKGRGAGGLLQGKDDREKMLLHLTARDLVTLTDEGSGKKVQPTTYIVVEERIAKDTYQELGRTEVVVRSSSPTYARPISVDYVFEAKQKFRISLFYLGLGAEHSEKYAKNLNLEAKGGNKMCHVEAYLHTILMEEGKNLTLRLRDAEGHRLGKVTAKLEEVKVSTYRISFQLAGKKMTNFGVFNSIKPRLIIMKPIISNAQMAQLNRGELTFKDFSVQDWKEVVSLDADGENSTFEIVHIDSWKLLTCGSFETPLRITLNNRKSDGSVKLKGQKIIKASALRGKGNFFQMHNDKRKSSAGTISVENFAMQKVFSFNDYLRGGLDIQLIVGIDFTKNNVPENDKEAPYHLVPKPTPGKEEQTEPVSPGTPGSPDDPRRDSVVSLAPEPQHQVLGNHYEQAIRAVCERFADYSISGKINAYGFGGSPTGFKNLADDKTDIFNINGKKSPVVRNLDGLLNAYKNSLDKIELFEEQINFLPVLEKGISKTVKKLKTEKNFYVVVLLLASGSCSNQKEFVEKLVKTTELPMSVILVGIGKGVNYSFYKSLDVVNGQVVHPALKGRRANFHFVDYHSYVGRYSSIMAAEVLKKIPIQAGNYFRLKKIEPGEAMERVAPARRRKSKKSVLKIPTFSLDGTPTEQAAEKKAAGEEGTSTVASEVPTETGLEAEEFEELEIELYLSDLEEGEEIEIIED